MRIPVLFGLALTVALTATAVAARPPVRKTPPTVQRPPATAQQALGGCLYWHRQCAQGFGKAVSAFRHCMMEHGCYVPQVTWCMPPKVHINGKCDCPQDKCYTSGPCGPAYWMNKRRRPC
jgi:hypothetical protein